MHIEELEDGEMEARSREEGAKEVGERKKRALVGVGARFLFYPTLLYNLVRNRLETTFHWWDEVDQYLLLGAVPFPADIPRLKQVGVRGVVTLNEPYETLVPTSFYHAHGIENLVIPTRDYLYAPSFDDICQAVDFIHKNASCGKTTYVHCKAGRGRSTTIVLCYLVQHKGMTPTVAYEHVRSRRPRVLLAASQRQAVQEYYHLRVEKTVRCSCLGNPITRMATPVATTRNFVTFDDSSFIIISETDLDGYVGELNHSSGNAILAEFYKVQLAGHTAMARLSRIWVRYRAGAGAGAGAGAMVPESRIRRETCSSEADPVCCGHNPFLLTGMAVNL